MKDKNQEMAANILRVLNLKEFAAFHKEDGYKLSYLYSLRKMSKKGNIPRIAAATIVSLFEEMSYRLTYDNRISPPSCCSQHDQ